MKTMLHDKLTDAHTTLYTKPPRSMIYEHNADFAPIPFVDGARTVQHRHCPLAGQPAPRPYSRLRPPRQLDRNTGPHDLGLRRLNVKVICRV